MNAITRTTSQALQLPEPRVALSFRLATMADLPWIDGLHKRHGDGLGYWPTKQFEGYIEMGAILIAEEATERRREGSAFTSDEATKGNAEEASNAPLSSPSVASSLPSMPRDRSVARPLGYCISRDRYLKRDELGVIYQLCVEPGYRRSFVGAALVREVFQRSAYGCRLYCLWCAQDLPANRFWESIGFVPIAFRAGSDKKKRVHIFWEKRIDGGSDEATKRSRGIEGSDEGEDGGSDEGADQSAIGNRKSAIPYWYPSQTAGGAMRADRLVFPIPPGTHWTEVRAVSVPTVSVEPASGGPWRLRGPASVEATERRSGPETSREATKGKADAKAVERSRVSGLFFGAAKGETSSARETVASEVAPDDAPVSPPARVKKKARRKPATRIDPKFLAATREFRDRYLERLNTPGADAALSGAAKYDVRRLASAAARPVPSLATRETPLLAA